MLDLIVLMAAVCGGFATAAYVKVRALEKHCEAMAAATNTNFAMMFEICRSLEEELIASDGNGFLVEVGLEDDEEEEESEE
jgi:hypothetical protein